MNLAGNDFLRALVRKDVAAQKRLASPQAIAEFKNYDSGLDWKDPSRCNVRGTDYCEITIVSGNTGPALIFVLYFKVKGSTARVVEARSGGDAG